MTIILHRIVYNKTRYDYILVEACLGRLSRRSRRQCPVRRPTLYNTVNPHCPKRACACALHANAKRPRRPTFRTLPTAFQPATRARSDAVPCPRPAASLGRSQALAAGLLARSELAFGTRSPSRRRARALAILALSRCQPPATSHQAPQRRSGQERRSTEPALPAHPSDKLSQTSARLGRRRFPLELVPPEITRWVLKPRAEEGHCWTGFLPKRGRLMVSSLWALVDCHARPKHTAGRDIDEKRLPS